MGVSRLRILCIEIYTTSSLSPSFMSDIFKEKLSQELPIDEYKLNLDIPKWNQVTFGTKTLKVYGPKIWNPLPYHIKNSANLKVFKTLSKTWGGVFCSCPRYIIFSSFC